MVKLVENIKKDYSIAFILIANLVVIILALLQNWSFEKIFYIYFIQGIIIGFFFFLKMISYKNLYSYNKKVNLIGRIIFSLFILIVLGFFYFLYFQFVFMFFTLPRSLSGTYESSGYILIPIIVFFITHLFSFIIHYRKDSIEEQDILNKTLKLIARIVPMHLTIIASGIFIVVVGFISIFVSNGSYSVNLINKGVLVVFLIIKTIIDYKMHIYEHSGILKLKKPLVNKPLA
jgi:hypothetical protein